MFKLFKKKCPVCKMELKQGEEDKYVGGFNKKFCSEECREKYRETLAKEQSKSGGGCCH